jgi:lipoprotein signal peptidase
MMGGPSAPLLLLSIGAVLVCDQAVKSVVVGEVRDGQLIRFGSLIRIRPVRCRTFAGRLGVRTIVLSFAWFACLLAVVLIPPLVGRFDSALSQAALGAALGGAAGNLLDVVVRRGVVDYLEVGPWPALNLADVAIVSGVIGGLLAH